MRLIHTTSGLLSIIGAAFLFATTHALIIKPINLDEPELTGGDAPVNGGDPERRRPPVQPAIGSNSDDPAGNPSGEQPDLQSETGADPEDGQEPTTDPEIAVENPEPSPIDAMLDAPVPEGMLTLRQSRKLWEDGAYFIDARNEDEFIDGHIQYASWLTSTLISTDTDRAFAVIDSMPPNATVVIYCVGGECDASKNVAARLQEIGFTDLRVMGVGYEDWVMAGFETEEGQP